MYTKLLPLALLSLGLVSACTGNDDDGDDNADDNADDNNDDNNDDTTPTGETGTEPPEESVLNVYTLYSQFGYDRATSTIVEFIDTADPENPQTLPSFFAYTFYDFDEGAGTVDPNSACGVQVDLIGATFAPWVQDNADIYYGVDSAASPAIEDTCGAALFTTELQAFYDDIKTGVVGTGIGALSPDAEDIIVAQGYEVEDTDIGGYALIPPYTDVITDLFGFAIEMNEAFETVTTPGAGDYDEYVTLTVEDIAPDASGIPQGIYVHGTAPWFVYTP